MLSRLRRITSQVIVFDGMSVPGIDAGGACSSSGGHGNWISCELGAQGRDALRLPRVDELHRRRPCLKREQTGEPGRRPCRGFTDITESSILAGTEGTGTQPPSALIDRRGYGRFPIAWTNDLGGSGRSYQSLRSDPYMAGMCHKGYPPGSATTDQIDPEVDSITASRVASWSKSPEVRIGCPRLVSALFRSDRIAP
jgi:hypothetical protein